LDILSKIGLARIELTKRLLEVSGVVVDIPLNDQPTLRRIFIEGLTLAISDLEPPHSRKNALRMGKLFLERDSKLTIKHLDQVIAVARPAAETRNRFYASLIGKRTIFKEYPDIEDILGETQGVTIYQDQVMRIATDLAGLPLDFANRLRKVISLDADPSESRILIFSLSESLAKRFPQYIVRELIDQVKNFHSFGFVEGHSESLAITAYEQAYLAEHYPEYFWSAVFIILSQKRKNHLYPVQAYINEAIRSGITFRLRPINRILLDFTPGEDGEVMVGRNILKRSKYFENQYNQIYKMLYLGSTNIADLIFYQLEYLGMSFTHNPIKRYKKNFHFNYEKGDQVVIGQVIYTKEYGDIAFVTLDSGTIVDLTWDINLYNKSIKKKRKDKKIRERIFVKVAIKKEINDSWSVSSVLPITKNDLI